MAIAPAATTSAAAASTQCHPAALTAVPITVTVASIAPMVDTHPSAASAGSG